MSEERNPSNYFTLNEKWKMFHKLNEIMKNLIPSGAQVCYSKPYVLSKKRDDKIETLESIINNNGKKTKQFGYATNKLGNLFKDSLDAEAWTLCIPLVFVGKKKVPHCLLDDSLEFAFKLMPITKTDYDNQQNIMLRPWREIYILMQSTNIYRETRNPNVPLYFGHNLCLNVSKKMYTNSRIKSRIEASDDEYGKRAVFIFNEPASYDLEYWIKNKFIDIITLNKFEELGINIEELIESMTFQIFIGLYALQSRINVVHFDFHVGNVLITELIPGGYIEYVIDDESYYIPNLGFLCSVWDFSRSILLDTDPIKLIQRKIIFHGKRNFSESVYEKMEGKIRKNLSDNFEKYKNLIYSYDVFKFSKTFALGLEIKIKKSTTTSPASSSRASTRKIKIKESKEGIEFLKKINKFVAPNITTRLASPRAPKPNVGSTLSIIKKFFGKYKTPPKKGKIIDTIKVI